jgi:hypothetical protein
MTAASTYDSSLLEEVVGCRVAAGRASSFLRSCFKDLLHIVYEHMDHGIWKGRR